MCFLPLPHSSPPLRPTPRYVATPLAGLLNVKEKIRLKATPNPVLEKFYASSTKHPKQVRCVPPAGGTGRRVLPATGMVLVLHPGAVGQVPGLPSPTWGLWELICTGLARRLGH